jgi:chromosome segregation ATPase
MAVSRQDAVNREAAAREKLDELDNQLKQADTAPPRETSSERTQRLAQVDKLSEQKAQQAVNLVEARAAADTATQSLRQAATDMAKIQKANPGASLLPGDASRLREAGVEVTPDGVLFTKEKIKINADGKAMQQLKDAEAEGKKIGGDPKKTSPVFDGSKPSDGKPVPVSPDNPFDPFPLRDSVNSKSADWDKANKLQQEREAQKRKLQEPPAPGESASAYRDRQDQARTKMQQLDRDVTKATLAALEQEKYQRLAWENERQLLDTELSSINADGERLMRRAGELERQGTALANKIETHNNRRDSIDPTNEAAVNTYNAEKAKLESEQQTLLTFINQLVEEGNRLDKRTADYNRRVETFNGKYAR